MTNNRSAMAVPITIAGRNAIVARRDLRPGDDRRDSQELQAQQAIFHGPFQALQNHE
ncbi:hypothetical protein [Lignipirellula cremea]|uniref:hypothetical protein n=1 Tax=Lignipirellula cremea TaxID=2528010 RepID=UPI0018D21D3B|nr:hypothetical protein [Lignipirellula cremea]